MSRHEQTAPNPDVAAAHDAAANYRIAYLAQTTRYEATDNQFNSPWLDRSKLIYNNKDMPWPAIPYEETAMREPSALRRMAGRIGSAVLGHAVTGFRGAIYNMVGKDDGSYEESRYMPTFNEHDEIVGETVGETVDEFHASRSSEPAEQPAGSITRDRVNNIIADIEDAGIPTLDQLLAAQEISHDLIMKSKDPVEIYTDRKGNVIDGSQISKLEDYQDLDAWHIDEPNEGFVQRVTATAGLNELSTDDRKYFDAFAASGDGTEGNSVEEQFQSFQKYVNDSAQLSRDIDAYKQGTYKRPSNVTELRPGKDIEPYQAEQLAA